MIIKILEVVAGAKGVFQPGIHDIEDEVLAQSLLDVGAAVTIDKSSEKKVAAASDTPKKDKVDRPKKDKTVTTRVRKPKQNAATREQPAE